MFDDAHRRPDLDRLITNSRQHSGDVRCVVSCRPSAVGIVTPLLSQLLPESGPVRLDLPRLAKADAENLARHYLGTGMAHLAGRLVDVADRNPLVIRVGAQCIANDPVIPEMLERTPEVFRRVALDRLLNDPSLSASDAAPRRQILEVLAAIGPAATEDGDLVSRLAAHCACPDHDVRRLLAGLERTHFLRRRGRLVRVSPDVLSDHVLYRAAVDEMGRPTGFVDKVVAAYPASLENVLANAAELDWRSATASPGSERVLRAVWQDLMTLLPSYSNRTRAELVGQLKRSSIFAPADVLTIVEWLVRRREAPKDDLLEKWGLEDSPDRVTENLTEILFLISSNPEFTARCADLLWALGAGDDRPLHPHPSHPRRRLGELLEYDRRSGWESPDGAQVKAIEFMVARLRDKSRHDDASWAVAALGNALDRTGEANEWNRRVLTLKEFSLAYAASALAERRAAVVGCLRSTALESRLGEAAAALAELGKLLRPPRGPFGRGLEARDIAVWQTEAERAIGVLQEVARSGGSDVVRYLARRELRSIHRDHWREISVAVDRALVETPPEESERLYDLLIGTPWTEQGHDWVSEETRLDALCKAAAEELWRRHREAPAVVGALLESVAALREAGREREPQVGRLVHSLVHSTPGAPQVFVLQLVEREESCTLLRPGLIAAHEREPAATEELLLQLAGSEFEAVRASAVNAIQWVIERATDLGRLVELTRRICDDRSPIVRAAAARVSRRLAKRAPSDALDLITRLDWGTDLWLANEVLGTLDATHGIDPQLLTDADVDLLLSRIELVRTLEGRNYEVFQFLAFASHRRPRQTIDTLIRRIRAIDEHEGKGGEDRWLRYHNGHGLELPGVQQSPDHRLLVTLIRDASSGASSGQLFWLPVLFHAADPNLAAGRDVLREWAASGEPEKISAAASLLRGFDHCECSLNTNWSPSSLVRPAAAATSAFGTPAVSCQALRSAGSTRAAPESRRHVTCMIGQRQSVSRRRTLETGRSGTSISRCAIEPKPASEWTLRSGRRTTSESPSFSARRAAGGSCAGQGRWACTGRACGRRRCTDQGDTPQGSLR